MKTAALIFSLLYGLLLTSVHAEPSELKVFDINSYPRILQNHQNEALMLVIWSYTCSSCLKELSRLRDIVDKYPELSVVILAVDDLSAAEQIQPILAQYRLDKFENWVFSQDNSAKLRYSIDPLWYGELPRTYFFDKAHNRRGISGVLDEVQYQSIIESLLVVP